MNELIANSEAYSELCQTSNLELFAKTVDCKPLILFAKNLHLRCFAGFTIRYKYVSGYKDRTLGQPQKIVSVSGQRPGDFFSK